MCTVSVITGENSYLLGMNRDEKLVRGAAEEPSAGGAGAVRLLCPRDVEGGTWVGVNEYGNAFALLNWHDVLGAGQRELKSRSRGHVIPHAAAYRSVGQLELSWSADLFAGMLPFRLIGVFPEALRLMEWRWNMQSLEAVSYGWASRHWFSSGLSDAQAEAQRGEVCLKAWQEAEPGTSQWLRRLHASHANGPGPFSICVHREDVRTLSYTEISFRGGQAQLTYFPGGLCAPGPATESTF